MRFSTKIDGITSESQNLVDMYLVAQAKSGKTIMSALRRLVEEVNKNDLTDIDYNDYVTYIKPFVEEGKTGQVRNLV